MHLRDAIGFFLHVSSTKWNAGLLGIMCTLNMRYIESRECECGPSVITWTSCVMWLATSWGCLYSVSLLAPCRAIFHISMQFLWSSHSHPGSESLLHTTLIHLAFHPSFLFLSFCPSSYFPFPFQCLQFIQTASNNLIDFNNNDDFFF